MGRPTGTMKEALINWYRAMIEADLLSEDATLVKEFVMGTGQASEAPSKA